MDLGAPHLIQTTEWVLALTRFVKAEYKLALVGCIPRSRTTGFMAVKMVSNSSWAKMFGTSPALRTLFRSSKKLSLLICDWRKQRQWQQAHKENYRNRELFGTCFIHSWFLTRLSLNAEKKLGSTIQFPATRTHEWQEVADLLTRTKQIWKLRHDRFIVFLPNAKSTLRICDLAQFLQIFIIMESHFVSMQSSRPMHYLCIAEQKHHGLVLHSWFKQYLL